MAPGSMPLRPLHRWKSFWLGVFVVVFLGWAWVRSRSHTNGVYFWSVDFSVVWLNTGSTLGVLKLPFGSASGSKVEWISAPGRDSKEWFPPWIKTTDVILGGSVYIAHWFLILLFLLPWTTWLVWRSRRMKMLD